MIDGRTIGKSLGEVGMTVLWVLLATVVIEVILYFVLDRWLKWKYAFPFMLLTPALIGLSVLVIYPLMWELNISFTNMSLRHFKDWTYSGFDQYIQVFTSPVLKQATFFPLLLRTILWTGVNVIFHVGGGLALALLLNREMKGKGFYRAIIILPWAIPQIIAVMAWRGEFHYEYGFFNVILTQIGLQPVKWLTDPTANFIAMCMTNIWLGIPFMMVILLGALQSVSGEYYEAAEIDGANRWQMFWGITMPMIRPVMTPAVILGTVWTFNNFNIPYFINQFELETSDILVTALFRAAFQYNRYAFSAAFAFVIFIILLLYSVFYVKITGALKGATE
jgi:arabinogalactan oligomer/maltooligosaccharide transport system permease protein